jgi:hypothetical protein
MKENPNEGNPEGRLATKPNVSAPLNVLYDSQRSIRTCSKGKQRVEGLLEAAFAVAAQGS